MASSLNTLLDVINPQTFYCQVWSYLASHSLLLLRAYQDALHRNDYLYLLFEGVLYFEGPMSWQGINFHLGTSDECLRLLHQRGGYDGISDDYLLARINLFKTQIPGGEVKILANNIHVDKNIPGDFYWLVSGPPG